MRHIFREAEGHVADLPIHREILLAGRERATDLDSGPQWQIVNAGINLLRRTFNPQAGLKKL